jgi:hypothetical protein
MTQTQIPAPEINAISHTMQESTLFTLLVLVPAYFNADADER